MALYADENIQAAVLLRNVTGNIIRGCVCAAAALCSLGAIDCFAFASTSVLDVVVESISYQGNSTYKVEMEVHNRSERDIVVKENSQTFQVQTEILGRWQELSVSDTSPDGVARIPAGKRLRVVYKLGIPPALRYLYRNSEGDINMKHVYRIRFATGSGGSDRSEAGESSYWITPGTDKWVLREGM